MTGSTNPDARLGARSDGRDPGPTRAAPVATFPCINEKEGKPAAEMSRALWTMLKRGEALVLAAALITHACLYAKGRFDAPPYARPSSPHSAYAPFVHRRCA